ncbi:MAG: methionine--tRNA ligase subunit beta, partial [Brevinema sp.]
RILAFGSFPIIPDTSNKLWRMLGQTLELKEQRLSTIINENLVEGQKLNPSEILFKKIEDEQISEQIDKLNKQAGRKIMQAEPIKEAKPEITIEDFMKIDLRVAEIISAEIPENSKKLLKLQVKVGSEQRQIMAGIKEFFAPEELVGKKIVIVYNLKPAKLAGELSEGMLLAASTEDKSSLFLVNPGDIPSGSGVR